MAVCPLASPEPREVTICGELEGRYWEMSSRELPGSGGGNLATLWASSKIEALEDSQYFRDRPGCAIRAGCPESGPGVRPAHPLHQPGRR